jgi:hypothetical protein
MWRSLSPTATSATREATMAKTYKELKADYDKLYKSTGEGAKRAASFDTNVEHFKRSIVALSQQLGERAEELRHNGHVGRTLTDFLADNEVKQLHERMQDEVELLERARLDILKLKAAQAKDLDDLKDDLKDALPALERALARATKDKKEDQVKALGLDKKLMEELPAKIKTLTESDYWEDLADARVPEAGALKKLMDTEIKERLERLPEPERISAEVEKAKAYLNPRRRAGIIAGAKKIEDDIEKLVAEAKELRKNGEILKFTVHKDDLADKLKALQNYADNYNQMYRHPRIHRFIDVRDRPPIEDIADDLQRRVAASKRDVDALDDL